MLTSVVSHKFYIQSGQEELSQRSRRGDREGMAVEDLLRNVTDKLGHGAWGMGHGAWGMGNAKSCKLWRK
jgi:hypothetical protein